MIGSSLAHALAAPPTQGVDASGSRSRWERRAFRRSRQDANGSAAARTSCGGRSARGCAAVRERSEKLERSLDEVLVELEHPAVPGVGVEDEVAVGESLGEIDGVLAGHHLVALTVHDEDRLA